jgi:hypothetical protein
MLKGWFEGPGKRPFLFGLQFHEPQRMILDFKTIFPPKQEIAGKSPHVKDYRTKYH